MAFHVFFTQSAARDLEELYSYIVAHDSPRKAAYVLEQIESRFVQLSAQPESGVYPKELVSLGIRDFREIFFKPYRIIYRVIHETVYIYLIADGLRDMQTLLQKRLLRA